MKTVLVAGATGYLGQYLVAELLRQGYQVRALVRNPQKLAQGKLVEMHHRRLTLFEAEMTEPQGLKQCCQGVDVVISTVGITRQKDGLTYEDVDYQGNLNLLREAQVSQNNPLGGVKKFLYVSVFKGEQLQDIAIGRAKERFVRALKDSGLDYCVIRPNGFFSDVKAFFDLASQGRGFVFGNGQFRSNPIHGADLAEVCVSAITGHDTEIEVGGPEVLTQQAIVELAFQVQGKPVRLHHIPLWIKPLAMTFGKFFLGAKAFGPVEFFLTVMTMDMVAPTYGDHTLKTFFETLNTPQQKHEDKTKG